MSNQPQQFRQHHITRALKAAAAAGQQLYAAHRKGAMSVEKLNGPSRSPISLRLGVLGGTDCAAW